MPVDSPCIKVCVMNAQNGLCDGCLRTLNEIAAWGRMADDERRQTLARCAERAAAQRARS